MSSDDPTNWRCKEGPLKKNPNFSSFSGRFRRQIQTFSTFSLAFKVKGVFLERFWLKCNRQSSGILPQYGSEMSWLWGSSVLELFLKILWLWGERLCIFHFFCVFANNCPRKLVLVLPQRVSITRYLRIQATKSFSGKAGLVYFVFLAKYLETFLFGLSMESKRPSPLSNVFLEGFDSLRSTQGMRGHSVPGGPGECENRQWKLLLGKSFGLIESKWAG